MLSVLERCIALTTGTQEGAVWPLTGAASGPSEHGVYTGLCFASFLSPGFLANYIASCRLGSIIDDVLLSRK
jgi:hypothetical protein